MKKYKVKWNAICSNYYSNDLVEANNEQEALNKAYDIFKRETSNFNTENINVEVEENV